MSFIGNARQMGRLHLSLNTFTGRLGWLCGLTALFVIAVVLTLLLQGDDSSKRAEALTVFLMAGPLGFLMPFAALVSAQSLAVDDLEGGMGSYLFVRPIHRTSILVGRALVAAGTLYVLMTVATTVVALVAGVGIVLWPFVMALLVGLLAVPFYLGLFAFLSFLVRSSVAVGFGFIALVDLILAGVPFRIHLIAPRFHFLVLWAKLTKAVTGDYPTGGLTWSTYVTDAPAWVTALCLLLVCCLFWFLTAKRFNQAEV